MSRAIKAYRDLYFRYLRGTDLEDETTPAEVACVLHRAGLIDLFESAEGTGLTHYRDTGLMLGTSRQEILNLIREYVEKRILKNSTMQSTTRALDEG